MCSNMGSVDSMASQLQVNLQTLISGQGYLSGLDSVKSGLARLSETSLSMSEQSNTPRAGELQRSLTYPIDQLHHYDRVEPKHQICFDFTKNQCKRGDRCKFSHDVDTIIKINSQEQGICFDFLKGQCNRGPMCRFSHDPTSIIQHQNQHGFKTARKNAPICYDFVKNQCIRGLHCRYTHDLTMILASSKNDKEMCLDYQRGRCQRGILCRYSHAALNNAVQQSQLIAAGPQPASNVLLQNAATQQTLMAIDQNRLNSLLLQQHIEQLPVATAQPANMPLASHPSPWGASLDQDSSQILQLLNAMQQLQRQTASMQAVAAKVPASLPPSIRQTLSDIPVRPKGPVLHMSGDIPQPAGVDDFQIPAHYKQSVLMPSASMENVLKGLGSLEGPRVERCKTTSLGALLPSGLLCQQTENMEPLFSSWNKVPIGRATSLNAGLDGVLASELRMGSMSSMLMHNMP